MTKNFQPCSLNSSLPAFVAASKIVGLIFSQLAFVNPVKASSAIFALADSKQLREKSLSSRKRLENDCVTKKSSKLSTFNLPPWNIASSVAVVISFSYVLTAWVSISLMAVFARSLYSCIAAAFSLAVIVPFSNSFPSSLPNCCLTFFTNDLTSLTPTTAFSAAPRTAFSTPLEIPRVAISETPETIFTAQLPLLSFL